MNERIISWFALHEDTYVALVSNEEGILQSQIFPGLWFDTNGFWKDDMPAVLATLQRGMASSAYRNFTESLSVN